MLYISIALVIITVILTKYPPSFTINRTYKMIQDPMPQIEEATEGPENMDKLHRDLPPNLDNVVQSLNEVLFQIGGADE